MQMLMLSDQSIIYAYVKAKDLNLEVEFIALLEQEIKRRKLRDRKG